MSCKVGGGVGPGYHFSSRSLSLSQDPHTVQKFFLGFFDCDSHFDKFAYVCSEYVEVDGLFEHVIEFFFEFPEELEELGFSDVGDGDFGLFSHVGG